MIKKFLIVVLMIVFFISIHTSIHAASVEYIGKPEGIISTKENFFSDFNYLVPGDIKEDYIEIKNKTSNEIEIFFRTECDDEESRYLISNIKLSIVLEHNGTQTQLYDGNLASNELDEYVSLGEYYKSYDGKLHFKIEVPRHLDNTFAKKRAEFKWIFMVRDSEIIHEEEEPEKTEEQEESETPIDINEDNEIIIEHRTVLNIKTGDGIIFYIIALLASVLIMIILIIIKKSDKKKNENKKDQL